ncbi:MAG: VWA domain-containing protein [Armatimonadota bacterium]
MGLLRFENPETLHLLWAVGAAGLLIAWGARARARALARFGAPALIARLAGSISPRRRRARAALVLVGMALVVLALARPQLGTRVETLQRRGIDIVVAVDCSESMAAEDVKPSRLETARREIRGLLSRLRGDRIGIVAFAGTAFTQCPLTLDYLAAEVLLDGLGTDLIPTPGTRLGPAIGTAIKAFQGKPGKHKAIVLITDGEDHAGAGSALAEPLAAAERAAEAGVVIHTIGVGGARGEPIPLYDDSGARTGYKKDQSGKVVLSALNDRQLKRIASASGGRYYPAASGELGLDEIYRHLSRMEQKEIGTRRFTEHAERYQWALVPGIVLLCIATWMGERRRAPEGARGEAS